MQREKKMGNKKYYEKNKEKISAKRKVFYLKNKKTKEYFKHKKSLCECGKEVTKGHKCVVCVEFKGFHYSFQTHFYCIHNKVKEFQNEI
jgi:hypothetical protein